MGKVAIPGRPTRKGRAGKKNLSHGTFRCRRKPNSPRCKNKEQ